jgi:hypothetical protein
VTQQLPLVCPACGGRQALDERFCAACGVPFGPAEGEPALDPRQAVARKIDPRYTQGPLVWAAGARNQVEAEFIAGLLLEEGVPSLIRRAAGFDVPDFMASGPREILVPTSGSQAARDILLDTGLRVETAPRRPELRTQLIAGLLLAIALIAIVLFMATHTWD